MTTVYMSPDPDPYFKAFEEIIDLHKFDLAKHHITGLFLAHSDNRLLLGSIAPGIPGTKIPHWQSGLKGARFIKVGNILVSSIADAQDAFTIATALGFPSIT